MKTDNISLPCTRVAFVLFLLIFGSGCINQQTKNKVHKTENVIVVVIDGPRYSETWGDPNHTYLPRLANDLAPHGVYYTEFYNNGPTYTNAGHSAITTGNYQEIDNSGKELAQNPSFFQYWLKNSRESEFKAWVVTSKDKLEILSDCQDSAWQGTYNPSVNSGVGGLGVGSGYRHDSATMERVLDVMATHHPKLMLVNFREPDRSGHKKNWEGYLQGIRDTDQYVYELYQFIQQDSIYAGKTSLFITNDHGRHLDDVKNGFFSHGCSCDGCRHINLFAFGPDFKQGHIEKMKREQIDIPATIAYLLGFDMPTGQGDVMSELFQ